MFTDADLKNLAFCVDFTRRNAPMNGNEVAAIGGLINAVQAEIVEREKAAAAVPKQDTPK